MHFCVDGFDHMCSYMLSAPGSSPTIFAELQVCYVNKHAISDSAVMYWSPSSELTDILLRFNPHGRVGVFRSSRSIVTSTSMLHNCCTNEAFCLVPFNMVQNYRTNVDYLDAGEAAYIRILKPNFGVWDDGSQIRGRWDALQLGLNSRGRHISKHIKVGSCTIRMVSGQYNFGFGTVDVKQRLIIMCLLVSVNYWFLRNGS